MEVAALGPRRLSTQELFEELKHAQHPTRRDHRAYIPGEEMLRYTFASWYMMNGGDLYELAKLLGHANIKMTERYAKLGKAHIAKTGDTAKLIWGLLERKPVQREQPLTNKEAHTA
jgi:site-specific recombinase XerD